MNILTQVLRQCRAVPQQMSRRPNSDWVEITKAVAPLATVINYGAVFLSRMKYGEKATAERFGDLVKSAEASAKQTTESWKMIRDADKESLKLQLEKNDEKLQQLVDGIALLNKNIVEKKTKE